MKARPRGGAVGVGLSGWLALSGAFGPAEASAAESPGEPLTVLAASSPRPTVCARAAELWRRVQRPALVGMCDLLLYGGVRLAEDAQAARSFAEQAQRLAPERAEPWVLLGRAELELGAFDEAERAFRRAEALSKQALGTPVELLSAARAAVHERQYASALERYRRLIPRVRLLTDRREQQRALLEAAMVAQLVSPPKLAEARAYASEARRQGELYYAELSRAVLALALDRQGHREEARAVAQEVGGPWAIDWLFQSEAKPRGRRGEIVPVWPLLERTALLAVLAQPVDAELARQSWEEYLEGAGEGVPPHLVEHARARAEKR